MDPDDVARTIHNPKRQRGTELESLADASGWEREQEQELNTVPKGKRTTTRQHTSSRRPRPSPVKIRGNSTAANCVKVRSGHVESVQAVPRFRVLPAGNGIQSRTRSRECSQGTEPEPGEQNRFTDAVGEP